ncbi:MAG: N-acetylneuraminate synthase family protein, partial [Candidatus Kapaibacterium sp.]
MKGRINNIEIDREKNGVFIVMEAGPTHTGLASAKQLAKAAKDAGADAVKFQTIFVDRLMAKSDVMFEYKILEIDNNGNENFVSIEEPLDVILKRRELKKEEWKELKKYCDEIGIAMFTTATYPDEVDFLVDECGIDSIKINSSDVNMLGFIKYVARKGVNIQLDTGNADIWEIERAVVAAEEEGCDNIIIHLCPSGYPARLESLHLNMITTLKQMFPMHSVAFSDHVPGWDMDIAAVALGAELIEKTITLDRTQRSCEHSFSLEPDKAKEFVKSIRDVETALGNARRIIPAEIKEKRKAGRRSPYAMRDLRAGDVIREEDFEFKRPGYGLSNIEFHFVKGMRLTQDMKKMDMLDKS